MLAASGAASGDNAVGEAVAQAVAGVDAPGLALFFPTPGAEAPAAYATEAASCPVAGMTASACLTERGPLLDGCSALAFDRSVPAGIGVAEHASADLETAAMSATSAALANVPVDTPHRLVLLFGDTRSGDHAKLVAGAYRAAGPRVPLAGGGAGGESPAQYVEDREMHDSVVAVAVGSKRPIGVGVADGCLPLGAPSLVTRAEGRTVLELDGRPAESVYLEKLGATAQERTDSEFARFAVLHPLAQPELSGDRRLRHVLGRARGGGLACATAVPANAAVEFTTQDPDQVIRSTWDGVSAALAPLDGEPAAAALVFDCAGRKRALDDRLEREIDTLCASFGRVPAMAGGYTHGEIGRARGAKGDRNHALVVVALA